MSRLINNSEQYRSRIESRNLYTPETPYRLEEGNVARAINSIVGVLSPFSTPNISNSVIGRIVSPFSTPLQIIGLEMLAKQFGYTVSSLASAEFQPTLSFSNLFDGDPNTKLFTPKVDFQITRRESQRTIGKILEEITGVYRPINPFKNNPTNLDYFNQTGRGQQILLINALNKSQYKPSSGDWQSAIQRAGYTYTKTTQSAPKLYFSDLNINLYPYSRYYDFGSNASKAFDLNNRLNNEKEQFIGGLRDKNNYEYGATQDYLDAFGKTNKFSNIDGKGDYRIDDNNFGLSDDNNDKIIWGRDGIDNNYDSIIKGFDGNIDDRNQVPSAKKLNGITTSGNYNENNNRFFSTDKPRTGLLNYTKELLNSRGKYGNFDLTKKKFVDKDENVFFNGMPLSENANGDIDRSRQHNITDPYNRFVKAIRFKGNELYGGNQNSTIYKTVLPKITPSMGDDGKADIKNLMFSLENLAISVSENGFLEDSDTGVQLPTCEIGSNGGRLMWFAPYDIKFSEQAIAKHESTNFIGRSEPIYTYSSSERIANLSFKLLIDYPPQLKGDPNLQSQSQAAKFMAFGSTGRIPKPVDIAQKEKEKEILIEQRDGLKPNKDIETAVNLPPIGVSRFHFPNDYPTSENINNIGSISAILFSQYEDGIADNADEYRTDDGLNSGFEDAFRNKIELAFSPDNRGKYDITLQGYSTVLYNSEGSGIPPSQYNLDLSRRRNDAMKKYIDEVYSNIYSGRTLQQDGININAISRGSEAAPQSTEPSDSINTLESKTYRRVDVIFNKKPQTTQPKEFNADLIQNIQRDNNILLLNTRISQLESEITEAKNAGKKGFECTFNQYTIEDGIMRGFEATQRRVNKFVPVFHSQTPEDFHRRLTFLQQCVRQGDAIRRKKEDDNGNIFSAKNSVFGRQPVQILRLGDFYNTKVIIDNITFDYGESPWDLNPEGMGMQFMFADITITMKVIGGQSMRGPIDALQNAVSFNYYANSTFYNEGVYAKATKAEIAQYGLQDDRNVNSNVNPLTGENIDNNDRSG